MSFFSLAQLFYSDVRTSDGRLLGYVTAEEVENLREVLFTTARKLAKKHSVKPNDLCQLSPKILTESSESERLLVPCPCCENGNISDARPFNLMFSTKVGPKAETSALGYLRPETAQGIFCNFKNFAFSSRMNPPFGVAQIGKAFRNEITARNFIFRSREFEQMEIEYFLHPDADWSATQQRWISDSKEWLTKIGIREDLLGFDVHSNSSLAHYARACTDITFRYPFGVQELMGIAARGDHDLSLHQNASKVSMQVTNGTTQEKYIPHVIEPSLGLDRLFLALLVSSYDEDVVSGEKRVVLRLHPAIAPISVAIFPLLKKPGCLETAERIRKVLARRFNVFVDHSGSIGRRYRRMDECGTPFCITVDMQSLEDHAVTIRERDSCSQIRIPISQLEQFLVERIALE